MVPDVWDVGFGVRAFACHLLHAMSKEFTAPRLISLRAPLQAGHDVIRLWLSSPQQVRRRLPLEWCVPIASRGSTRAARHQARRSLADSHFCRYGEHIKAWAQRPEGSAAVQRMQLAGGAAGPSRRRALRGFLSHAAAVQTLRELSSHGLRIPIAAECKVWFNRVGSHVVNRVTRSCNHSATLQPQCRPDGRGGATSMQRSWQKLASPWRPVSCAPSLHSRRPSLALCYGSLGTSVNVCAHHVYAVKG